ncbi:MAG: hypothetical protein M1813_007809 [Trichoglossum hirsutum]|nr:MAG: hypothetical protein M1813_007809 [Trichoglossum hirsutum]
MASTTSKLSELHKYSACDPPKKDKQENPILTLEVGRGGNQISDALLKLKAPGAGFLADIAPLPSRTTPPPTLQKQIAPASTVLFTPKHPAATTAAAAAATADTSNIPTGSLYVDLLPPGPSIIVMSQPAHQTNAVLGGIMAARMEVLGAVAVVVDGRVRDLSELRRGALQVYARGTSTVGAGAASVPHSINVPIDVNGITVHPGDIIFADLTEGVVCIPQDKLDDVIRILPDITAADERVLEAVKAGMEVREAFQRFRS